VENVQGFRSGCIRHDLVGVGSTVSAVALPALMFISMPMADFQSNQQAKALERIDKQLAELAESDPTMYFDGDWDDLFNRRRLLQAELEKKSRATPNPNYGLAGRKK
jgi:hypothetical protein